MLIVKKKKEGAVIFLRIILTAIFERGSIKMGDNMLIKFTVENYKSFKEPITIDFSDTHDYKFNSYCVKNGLLSKAVIYGPNGSGKSNLGFAIFDIVGLLTDKQVSDHQLSENNFINAESETNTAKFEYLFKKGEDVIKYSYYKTAPKIILAEELYVNDVKVFEYNFETKKYDFNRMDIIEAETLNLEYFENNLAVLRYVANNTIQSEDSYVRFIMNFVSHMLWFRSLQDNGYIGLTTGSEVLNNWIINNNLVKDFQAFLKEFADIDMELEVAKTNDPSAEKLIVIKHKNKPLVFGQVASSGTKALELFFYWSKRFDEVSFLFMDEFDAFYHYDLAKNILKYISTLNNVQAVITTHNSFLASNELLRPDCYFYLNNGKLTSFVNSTERELREGHSLEKMLRNGEFDG